MQDQLAQKRRRLVRQDATEDEEDVGPRVAEPRLPHYSESV